MSTVHDDLLSSPGVQRAREVMLSRAFAKRRDNAALLAEFAGKYGCAAENWKAAVPDALEALAALDARLMRRSVGSKAEYEIYFGLRAGQVNALVADGNATQTWKTTFRTPRAAHSNQDAWGSDCNATEFANARIAADGRYFVFHMPTYAALGDWKFGNAPLEGDDTTRADIKPAGGHEAFAQATALILWTLNRRAGRAHDQCLA